MKTSSQSFDYTYSSLYMAISAKCYALKIIEAPAVIEAYTQTMKVVESQLSRKPDDARYLEAKKNIDAVFRSSGAASCSTWKSCSLPMSLRTRMYALLRKVTTFSRDRLPRLELYFKVSTYLYRAVPMHHRQPSWLR